MATVRAVLFRKSFIGRGHGWRARAASARRRVRARGRRTPARGQPDEHRRVGGGVRLHRVQGAQRADRRGAGDQGAARPDPAAARLPGRAEVRHRRGRPADRPARRPVVGRADPRRRHRRGRDRDQRHRQPGRLRQRVRALAQDRDRARHPRRAERAVPARLGDAAQDGRRAACRWWSSTRRPSRAGRSGRSAPPTGRAACPPPGTSSSSATAGSPPSAGPDHLWSCRARLDGYRSALRRADLPVDEDLVRCDELTADAGLRRAGELLGLAEAADRDRGRQRRPGVRRAAGHRRARAALARRRQRDRVRRPARSPPGPPRRSPPSGSRSRPWPPPRSGC